MAILEIALIDEFNIDDLPAITISYLNHDNIFSLVSC